MKNPDKELAKLEARFQAATVVGDRETARALLDEALDRKLIIVKPEGK
jgi:hypothetical protein